MKMSEIEGSTNLKNKFQDQTKVSIGKNNELELELKGVL
jgi:hypothetical protein